MLDIKYSELTFIFPSFIVSSFTSPFRWFSLQITSLDFCSGFSCSSLNRILNFAKLQRLKPSVLKIISFSVSCTIPRLPLFGNVSTLESEKIYCDKFTFVKALNFQIDLLCVNCIAGLLSDCSFEFPLFFRFITF